jgi:hypothetical protein
MSLIIQSDMVFRKKWATKSLELTYTATTAREFLDFQSKTITHSEYETNWSRVISDWISKKYFTWVQVEQFNGTESVIFRITFVDVDTYENDFLKELVDYLTPNRPYIEYVSLGEIKHLINQ